MTILIAVIALIVLPEKVETARWLNEEEKEYCQSCFDLNAHSTTPTDQQ
jgi:hypothetical protein